MIKSLKTGFELFSQYIPPPELLRFPVMIRFFKTGLELSQEIPPPCPPPPEQGVEGLEVKLESLLSGGRPLLPLKALREGFSSYGWPEMIGGFDRLVTEVSNDACL